LTTLIFNEDPISTKHVCWFTLSLDSDSISLYEVVEATYEHPVHPTEIHEKCILIEQRKTAKRISPEASAWVLMEACQKTIK